MDYIKEKVIFESTKTVEQYDNKLKLLTLAGYEILAENNSLSCENFNDQHIKQCKSNVVYEFSDGIIVVTGNESAHYIYKPGRTPRPLNTNVYHFLEYEIVDVSKLDVKRYTAFTSMFSSGYMRKIIGLDKWDMSTAIDISYMFNECPYLSAIESIENWNVSNVINMKYMFSECPHLEQLDLSKWVIDKEVDMRDMFFYCSELKNIKLPKVNNCLSMIGMFSNCYAMKMIDLTSFAFLETVPVDKLNIFSCCTHLRKVIFPSLYEVQNNDTQTKDPYGNMREGDFIWGLLDKLNSIDLDNLTFSVPDEKTKEFFIAKLKNKNNKMVKFEVRNSSFALKPPCCN